MQGTTWVVSGEVKNWALVGNSSGHGLRGRGQKVDAALPGADDGGTRYLTEEAEVSGDVTQIDSQTRSHAGKQRMGRIGK